MSNTTPQRFYANVLECFIASALRRVGLPNRDAVDCGRLMIASDTAGFHTHGIFRLPQYIKRINAGGINVTPDITATNESPATAVVDGDNAMGHLVAEYAMKLAIAKAREAGCSWIGARGSNHAGAAATYVAMAAEENMIALYGTNGSANHMAPWGSADLLLGTNPIAAAIPAGGEAAVLMDIATSVTSFGKVRTAAQRGDELPPDWMIGRDGKPITDSSRIKEGILNPIGGHKGYALSLIIGLLAATLSGAQMGVDVENMGDDEYQRTPVNNGHFMVVVDPSRFGDLGDFGQKVIEVSESMRSAQPMPGVARVRVPGDGRAASIADAKQNGVPVHNALLKNLNNLADTLGIDRLT
ncbi:MAG: Ldh family oxidoreductase [Pseudomonadota bacterium]|nr:Ldh family oxidoreductase [Pseudomonadota bacterium]